MKLKAILANWKTTLLGVLPAILAVLIAFGIIDLEQQTAIVDGTEVVFDTVDSILNEVIAAIASIGAVIGLFSRDADKTSETSGAK
ncbi:MAG: hypothetical protein CMC35_02905 [Flavobacteriaceae bacterium]|nr:hypothetical protein [Flavobacteriaceae bacterium]|tara:strand:+ start:145 stop:402 length:258 start_codon:yes stop_codon:yes gene_type:complete